MAGDSTVVNGRLLQDQDEQQPPQASNKEGDGPTAFVWSLTFAARISGLLFGYE